MMNITTINRLYKDFLGEYDSGDLKFNNIQYRPGVPITASFGLSKGYRLDNGKWYWDTVRIHTGVDRGAGKVIAPFNFNRSELCDWGEDHDYGSMVRLFSDHYGFEMRITHMNPEEDIEASVLNSLKGKETILRGTYLGQAGSYGKSDGRHTHTEIVSIQEESPVLKKLLHKKYGQEVFNNYDDGYVLSFYNEQEFWKDKSTKEIFEHYDHLKNKYRISGILNQYQFQFKDWFYDMQPRTRYSSELLFNGL